MGFTVINEGFVCEACGLINAPAKGTCRNHCITCLTSKHVDGDMPGDRASSCHGLMRAIAVEGSDPEKLDLIHKCLSCGKKQRNKTAQDDNQDALFALMSPQG